MKKYGFTVLISEKKRKFSKQNLPKQWKQPPVFIPQQATFYNAFILCLGLTIIRSSDKGVYLLNFPSHIFFNNINHGYRAAILKKKYLWLLPHFMPVAGSSYYEKVHRTMRTSNVSYLLKTVTCWVLQSVLQNQFFTILQMTLTFYFLQSMVVWFGPTHPNII